MAEREVLMSVAHLKKYFPVHTGLAGGLFTLKKRYVRAVDDASLEIRKGEVMGLAGERGCGKTTTGTNHAPHRSDRGGVPL